MPLFSRNAPRARGPKGAERRAADRRRAVGNRAAVGWSEGAEFRQASATFADVSTGGAAMLVKGIFPTDRPVWVRLEEPDQTDWHEVKVVRCRRAGRRKQWVGLSFVGACPYQLHKLLSCGTGLEPVASDAAAEFDSRYWR